MNGNENHCAACGIEMLATCDVCSCTPRLTVVCQECGLIIDCFLSPDVAEYFPLRIETECLKCRGVC